MRQRKDRGRWGRGAKRALVLGVVVGALSACDDLLEVDLPHLLTDEAISGAGTAETQVNSAIALYECGMATFAWVALGHEDVFESIAGVAGGAHIFRSTPVAGGCDQNSQDQSWFDQIMGARAFISNDPAKFPGLSESLGEANGVYDKMNDGSFDLGSAGQRLSAISAIYMALSMQHFGEFYCEGALDGSNLVTDAQFRGWALDWVDRAESHIGSFGDFAMPNGVAASARNMARAIRAQVLWAHGDLAGAAAEAQTVLTADPGFNAYISREGGQERRNKVYHAGNSAGFSGMLGINDWWRGTTNNRAPNPATGQQWSDTIPFTGYIFLGIGPEGQTLETNGSVANMPVRWAQQQRDANEDPVSLGNLAVPDTRVEHIYKSIQGPEKREVVDKYKGDDEDIHLATWRELTLIRAEWENTTNNDQAAAIALINALRGASLPNISGAYATSLIGDQATMRAVILEERRRELYSESARYWSTKIQNTDLLWFPRRQGNTPFQGYILFGGVRLQFPDDEYTLNSNLAAAGGLALRGTGCDANEAVIPG
ncbi:MAG TPA: RagB/SusD family nutrient uptake outer membrane protein [Longimicrobiales bacterium]|nr:RagB/SusD family nutrient uptake outer membrane protein [Longimicrobiales bacterium]